MNVEGGESYQIDMKQNEPVIKDIIFQYWFSQHAINIVFILQHCKLELCLKSYYRLVDLDHLPLLQSTVMK